MFVLLQLLQQRILRICSSSFSHLLPNAVTFVIRSDNDVFTSFISFISIHLPALSGRYLLVFVIHNNRTYRSLVVANVFYRDSCESAKFFDFFISK